MFFFYPSDSDIEVYTSVSFYIYSLGMIIFHFYQLYLTAFIEVYAMYLRICMCRWRRNTSEIFRKETVVLDTTDGHRACMRFKTPEGDVILSKFDQHTTDITAVAMRMDI